MLEILQFFLETGYSECPMVVSGVCGGCCSVDGRGDSAGTVVGAEWGGVVVAEQAT